MPIDAAPDQNELLLTVMNLAPEQAIPDGLPGHWWVAHTKPRTEKALAGDLGAMKIAYYLPLRRRQTRSRHTGRISKSIVPVFASYLFFNGDEEQRHRALNTHRIANVLSVTSQDRFIGELRQLHRVLSARVDLQLHSTLKAGDWVRVVGGPLLGTEGIVTGRLSRTRLVLNVAMLGQSVSVRVDSDALERIDGPSYAS